MITQERRVLLALALCFLALVVASGSSFFAVKGLVAESGQVDHTQQVRNALEQLLSDYQEIQISLADALLTGSTVSLTPSAPSASRLDADLRQLSILVEDNPRQSARLASLANLQKQHVEQAARLIASRNGQGTESAAALLATGDNAKTLDDLRSLIAEMDREEAALLADRYATQRQAVTRLNLTLLASTLFAVLVVVLGGTVIHRDFAWRREQDLRLKQQHDQLEAGVAQRTQALRESELRLRLIVDGIRDYSVVMLDPTGTVVTWNSGAERITGYGQEEILGKSTDIFHVVDDISSGKSAQLLSQAVREGRSNDEGWRVRKDGSRFLANVAITPIRDDKGSLLGFAKITQDVTERRMTEDRNRRLADQQRAANEELSRFNRSMVDRELRMIELKKEINELCARLGEPGRYKPDAARDHA